MSGVRNGGDGVLSMGGSGSYRAVGALSSEPAASSTFCDIIASITTHSHDVSD
jgi:hypothetical protein